MHTTQRILGAAAVAVVAVSVPVAAGATAEEPAGDPGLPPSTHGAFLPLPPEALEPQTLPACGSEVTLSPGDVNESEYRALVTEDGTTVIETRGDVTVDVTRASDGAVLDEFALSGHSFQTVSADGLTVTFEAEGAGLVVPFHELEAQALAAEGLPEAFVFLEGTVAETVTLAAPPADPDEVPPVTSVEITENTAEYVFDLCDLLDQAAESA